MSNHTSDTTTVACPPCTMCGERATLTVPTLGLMAWQAGQLIQRALPDLTVDEREMLMSGIHPDCWDRLFGEED